MSSSSQQQQTIDPSQLDDDDFSNLLNCAMTPRYCLSKRDQNGNNNQSENTSCSVQSFGDSNRLLSSQATRILEHLYREANESMADGDASALSARPAVGTPSFQSPVSSAAQPTNCDFGIRAHTYGPPNVLTSEPRLGETGFVCGQQQTNALPPSEVDSSLNFNLNPSHPSPVALYWGPSNQIDDLLRSDPPPAETRIDMDNLDYIDSDAQPCLEPQSDLDSAETDPSRSAPPNVRYVRPANHEIELQPLVGNPDDEQSKNGTSYGTIACARNTTTTNKKKTKGSYDLDEANKFHSSRQFEYGNDQEPPNYINQYNRVGGRHSPPSNEMSMRRHYGTNNSLTLRGSQYQYRPHLTTSLTQDRASKKKKPEDKNVVNKMVAENYDGHQGHRSIESLLEFVEGSTKQQPEKKSPNNRIGPTNKKKLAVNSKGKMTQTGSSSRSLDESALDGHVVESELKDTDHPPQLPLSDDERDSRSSPVSSAASDRSSTAAKQSDQTLDLSDPGLYVADNEPLPNTPALEEEFMPVSRKKRKAKVTPRRSYDPAVPGHASVKRSSTPPASSRPSLASALASRPPKSQYRKRRNSDLGSSAELKSGEKLNDLDVGNASATGADQPEQSDPKLEQVSPKAPSEPGGYRRHSDATRKPLYSSVASRRPASPMLADFMDKAMLESAGATVPLRCSSSLQTSRSTSPKGKTAASSTQANASTPELFVREPPFSGESIAPALLSPPLPPAVKTLEQKEKSESAEVTIEEPKTTVKTWAAIAATPKVGVGNPGPPPVPKAQSTPVAEPLSDTVGSDEETEIAQSHSMLSGDSTLVEETVPECSAPSVSGEGDDEGSSVIAKSEGVPVEFVTECSNNGDSSLDISFGWEPSLEAASSNEHSMLIAGKTITFKVPLTGDGQSAGIQTPAEIGGEHASWVTHLMNEWNKFMEDGETPVWYKDLVSERQKASNLNTGADGCAE